MIRDLGRNFSILRNAHVRHLMFHELKPENSNNKPILEKLEEINQIVTHETEHFMLVEQNEFSALKDSLIANDQIEQYFVLNNPDPSAVLEIFSLCYLKSFHAFKASVDSPDPNLLHEWRKRLKDVQYQLELIYGNLSREIHAHYLKIQGLCELLGELNDLDMMNRWIFNNREKLSTDCNNDLAYFDGLIKKHESLLRNAITVGRELYTFTPEMFKEKLI